MVAGTPGESESDGSGGGIGFCAALLLLRRRERVGLLVADACGCEPEALRARSVMRSSSSVVLPALGGGLWSACGGKGSMEDWTVVVVVVAPKPVAGERSRR